MITPWDFKFAKNTFKREENKNSNNENFYAFALNLKHQDLNEERKKFKSRRHQFRYKKELVICVNFVPSFPYSLFSSISQTNKKKEPRRIEIKKVKVSRCRYRFMSFIFLHIIRIKGIEKIGKKRLLDVREKRRHICL